MIDFSKITATSQAAGFKNYNLTPTASTVTIPGQALAAGRVATVRATIPLDNADAVSLIKLQYATVQTYWHQVFGYTQSGLIAAQYSLQSNSFYMGGNLIIDTYAVNQAGPFVLPAQTINISVRLYKSPFGT